MTTSLKILHLEDNPFDAELIKRELQKSSIDFEYMLVETKKDFMKALKEYDPGIILCDHSLQSFDSWQALEMVSNENKKIPVIVITGSMSETFAVETIKRGAYDYFVKSNIYRLPNSITNALENVRLEIERKNYIKELEQTTELLKETERLAHLGSWFLNLENWHLVWSDETYRIYGFEPGEIEPSLESLLSFVHPDDLDYVKRMTDNSMIETSDSIKYNFRIIDKNKTIKYVRNELVVTRNSEGKPIRLTGFNLDITGQKEAEIRLIDSELRYKDLFDNNPMPMFIIDKYNFQFLNVNKAAIKHYGYTMEEFLGMTAVDIRRDEEKLRFINIDRSENQSLYEAGNWEHVKKDGTRILVEIHAENVLFERKEARLVLVIDVTKKKMAESALRKSEANMRSIFENPDISYLLLDTYLNIVSFNKRANEGFVSVEQGALVEGKNFLDYVPDERKTQVRERYLGVVDGKSANYESSFNRPDGSVYWLFLQLSPVKDEANNSLGMILVITDISEKKKAELEREKLVSDIMYRNKDLEQFTYIVSHNLRAPLANIIGTTEILQIDDLDAETAKEMLLNLSASVNHLDNVIKDLNYILQIKREVSEKNEMIRFSRIVEDIKTSISNLIKNENAEIITDFDEIDEFFTLKSYMYSVFYNLISNSIQYRRPDVSPIIEIKSAKVKNKIILTFNDNGLGIDLEKKGKQVFGLYKRFHFHKEGKGMGLYMTKTQVETMGGKIFVSSKVNEGTEFIIEFDVST